MASKYPLYTEQPNQYIENFEFSKVVLLNGTEDQLRSKNAGANPQEDGEIGIATDTKTIVLRDSSTEDLYMIPAWAETALEYRVSELDPNFQSLVWDTKSHSWSVVSTSIFETQSQIDGVDEIDGPVFANVTSLVIGGEYGGVTIGRGELDQSTLIQSRWSGTSLYISDYSNSPTEYHAAITLWPTGAEHPSGNYHFLVGTGSENGFSGLVKMSSGLAVQATAGTDYALPPVHQELTGTAINWSRDSFLYKTISSNTTFTFSNLTNGRTIVLVLTTSGTVQPTWPAGIVWVGKDSAPVQQMNSTAVYTFIRVNGVVYGYVAPDIGALGQKVVDVVGDGATSIVLDGYMLVKLHLTSNTTLNVSNTVKEGTTVNIDIINPSGYTLTFGSGLSGIRWGNNIAPVSPMPDGGTISLYNNGINSWKGLFAE